MNKTELKWTGFNKNEMNIRLTDLNGNQLNWSKLSQDGNVMDERAVELPWVKWTKQKWAEIKLTNLIWIKLSWTELMKIFAKTNWNALCWSDLQTR